jgi:tetratricopeptide (TPR) repeat protein
MAMKSAASSSASSSGTKATAGTPASAIKKPRVLAGQSSPVDDVARKSTIKDYESAIKLIHANKFDKAHEAFTILLASAPADIAPSIRMYITTCASEIAKGSTKFTNQEERYDYAVSLLNHGHYEDAREHFDAILKADKSCDYAFYGLALLAAMTCDSPRCIELLTEAIRLNPQNRLLARNDSDFESVADDPSFTELLYPVQQS